MIPYSRLVAHAARNVARSSSKFHTQHARTPPAVAHLATSSLDSSIISSPFFSASQKRHLHRALIRFDEQKKTDTPHGFGNFTSKSPSTAEKASSTTSTSKTSTSKEQAAPSAGARTKAESSSKTTKGERNENEGEDNKKDGESSSNASGPQWTGIQVGIAAAGIAALFYSTLSGIPHNEMSQQEMMTEYLAKGHVQSITVVNKQICRVTLRPDSPRGPYVFQFEIGNAETFEQKLEGFQLRMGLQPEDFIPIQYSSERDLGEDLVRFLPTLFLLIPLVLAARAFSQAGGMAGGMGSGGSGSGPGGRNIFNLGKAVGARSETKSKVKLEDVAGMVQAKLEVTEFVDFLRDPSKYHTLGARIPKGALLVGPPGTGKTMLAKAVAGEADVPFFSMSGSDFIEMFVGVGPSRVRDLFSQARQKSPSIIFIDEIDAVGRKRGKGGFSGGGNDERENTLNQLLVEMDGFSTGTGVVVLAGTNRADILDPALTRPGRFDRQIHISKPDLTEREEIFQVHLKSVVMEKDLDAKEVARRMASLTPGFAGSDIANICNESAIFAARRSAEGVGMIDFEQATERSIGGLKKENNLMTPAQKKIIALHESGHAVCGWFSPDTDPLVKVSIVPRASGALGYAQYLPEDMALQSKDALLSRMIVTLGGRASEELYTDQISTGAADDLDKVTQMAYSMVAVLGMNEKMGLVSFNPDRSEQQFYKPYSEYTNQIIDAEVRMVIQTQYEKAKALLKEKETVLFELANRLNEKETLVYSDLKAVLGERPYAMNKAYEAYATSAPEKKSPIETATTTTTAAPLTSAVEEGLKVEASVTAAAAAVEKRETP